VLRALIVAALACALFPVRPKPRDVAVGDLSLSSDNGSVLRRLPACSGARGVAFVGTAWVAAACHDAGALAFWSQKTWERRSLRVGALPYSVAEVVLP
jgi:hypothetical protein